MSDFSAGLRKMAVELERKTLSVFADLATEAHRSVQMGSEITGAPGQPVEEGTLRGSIHLAFETPSRATITTSVDYAEAVEEGVGPHGDVVYGAKNGIGGSHSFALTIAGIPAITEVVLARHGGR